MYMKKCNGYQRSVKKRGVRSTCFCGIWKQMRAAAVQEVFRALEQNRKNGSKNLRETLRLEMADAFEQRKHQAKRMGEKAGTKLLIRCFFSWLW